MKHFILTILLSTLTLANYAQQTYSVFQIRQKDRLWYKEGEEIPFTGIHSDQWHEAEYLNGEIIWEKKFDKNRKFKSYTKKSKDKNGKLYISEHIGYHNSGSISRKIEYKGPHGIETAYYPKKDENLLVEVGQISEITERYEGVKHGKQIKYTEDGKLKEESEWEYGKLKGWIHSLTYSKNGILDHDVYHNGEKPGSPDRRGWYVYYYANGNIRVEGNWDPDTVALSKSYTWEGKLHQESYKTIRPIYTETHKEYDPETGFLKEEYITENDQIISRKDFYKNGNLLSQEEHGKTKKYYKNGSLMSETEYQEKDKYCIINETFFYENGQLMYELHTPNGQNTPNVWLEGTQVRYHPNGTLQAKINFRDGKVTGKSVKTFHADGKLQAHILYTDSGKVEEGYIYYPDGTLFMERNKTGADGTTVININHEISENHIHTDNTTLLSGILLVNKENANDHYLYYFQTGKQEPRYEEIDFETADCSCGPEPGEIDLYEDLYLEYGFSGSIRIYSQNGFPVSESNYKNGFRHGRDIQWNENEILWETIYNMGEKVLPYMYVNDPDLYVNVRTEPSIEADIRKRLFNLAIVPVHKVENNWVDIGEGYIHQSRLALLPQEMWIPVDSFFRNHYTQLYLVDKNITDVIFSIEPDWYGLTIDSIMKDGFAEIPKMELIEIYDLNRQKHLLQTSGPFGIQKARIYPEYIELDNEGIIYSFYKDLKGNTIQRIANYQVPFDIKLPAEADMEILYKWLNEGDNSEFYDQYGNFDYDRFYELLEQIYFAGDTRIREIYPSVLKEWKADGVFGQTKTILEINLYEYNYQGDHLLRDIEKGK